MALVREFGLTAFWIAVGETMTAWFLGLIIAVGLAVLLGFGSSGFLRKATNSTVEFLRPIPSVALVLAITAELVIGSPGLGREIALAQSGGAISGMYAFVLATGLIGVLINVLMRFIEKKTLSWHSSVRSEVIV